MISLPEALTAVSRAFVSFSTGFPDDASPPIRITCVDVNFLTSVSGIGFALNLKENALLCGTRILMGQEARTFTQAAGVVVVKLGVLGRVPWVISANSSVVLGSR